MTRSFIAFFTLILLMLARASDLITTFFFDPDLRHEANAVAVLLGRTWGSLIVPALILFILLTIGLYLYGRGGGLKLVRSPKTLRKFVGLWVRTVVLDRQPFRAYFPRGSHANQGREAVRFFGLAVSWALIFGSFTAVYAWFALYGPVTTHRRIFSLSSIGSFTAAPSLLSVIGFSFGSYIFFRYEFEAHRKRSIERN